MIVDEIKNKAEISYKKPQQVKEGYLYGKKFIKPIRILTEVIITSFRELGIDFTVKSINFLIQARTIASNALISPQEVVMAATPKNPNL